jgi:hypothetical protein
MKKHTFIMLFFCVYTICNAKSGGNNDIIQICYSKGVDGIGGQDHCITIYFDDSLMFCQRICYSIFNDIPKYIEMSTIQAIARHYQENGIILKLDTEESKEQAVMRYYQENGLQGLGYKKYKKQAILRHYQENNNYMILDERVEINKSQFDRLIKIINEIKEYVSEGDNPDEIIINTSGGLHYMIKDESGTTVIIDWLGHYNRSGDIENVLGLKSYLRCPCVEKDLKQ